jgi:hypothetical protein
MERVLVEQLDSSEAVIIYSTGTAGFQCDGKVFFKKCLRAVLHGSIGNVGFQKKSVHTVNPCCHARINQQAYSILQLIY